MHLSDKEFFSVFLLLRVSSVYLVQSFFVPDEYWQSLEVSHKLTFGYGYCTWEWDKKIRSCIYPFILHLLYKAIPNSTYLIIHSPRIFQAIMSAIGDFYTYKFATKYFGRSCGLWTAFNILTSWFLFYCSPRTLTNMAEASLTSCGIYFYPWKTKCRLSSKYMWFAAISSIIRPTGIVVWLPLYIWHILREKHMLSLLKNSFSIGIIVLASMLLIDKWCYKDWVLTPYNFFLFNWSNDIGAFYGSHNFFWYFLIGLPTVLGLHIIPFLYGLLLPQLKQFYFLILWVLLIFSIPSHKEFRFLLPILHLCMIICGVVMNEIWHERLRLRRVKIKSMLITLFIPLLTVVNVSVGLYLGLYHQRGVIDASVYLSKSVNSNSSVVFLMPCHSTPYYSYIHKDIQMKFLTCEPNFENDPNYVEEADDFFLNPHQWLSKNYEFSDLTLPSHIVFFDALFDNISLFLKNHHYYKCFSAFHSHFVQGRTGNYVYIYCKQLFT